MRIWTLHPSHLDTKGLVAAWREALLAQHVLSGATKGYSRHPQLLRFKQHPEPMGAIASYLHHLHDEALGRGYSFQREKIGPLLSATRIPATQGQLLYEWEHLKKKLQSRAPAKYDELAALPEPRPHPLFIITPGEVESWEMIR